MPDMGEDGGDKGQPTKTNQPEDKTPVVQNVVDDERVEPGPGPVTVGAPHKNVPTERGRPTGSREYGRPAFAEDVLSTKELGGVVHDIEGLFAYARQEMKSVHKIKRLSQQKKDLLDDLCKNVVMAAEKGDWEAVVGDCVKDFSNIERLSPLIGVLE
ncbi:MAG: hypothetical protein GY915_08660, partial [bacterium]|nr:hypothetical protein [bacterium]